MWKILNFIEKTIKIVNLANFVVFLFEGKYPSVLDRILQMRIVSKKRNLRVQPDFDFMNRELAWASLRVCLLVLHMINTELQQFLIVVLPLINTQRIWNTIQSFRRSLAPFKTEMPRDKCLICLSQHSKDCEPRIPHEANCGHIFCYVCIK